MRKLSSLTIFFPALNDSKSIPYLVSKAYNVAPKVAKSFNVIVINDGSTDETADILQTLTKYFPRLTVIHHPKNLGYGAALRDGFAHATGEWVFYTDGDGQYDPEELIKLVHQLTLRVDVVNGYKLYRSDFFLRRLLGFLYNRVSHFEYDLPIRDVQCDFRLIRRSLFKKVRLFSSSGLICLELVTKLYFAGARFSEVGIHHYPRLHGRSQFFRPYNLWRTAREYVVMILKRYRRAKGLQISPA